MDKNFMQCYIVKTGKGYGINALYSQNTDTEVEVMRVEAGPFESEQEAYFYAKHNMKVPSSVLVRT